MTGTELKSRRESAGLTQMDLAARSGVAIATISAVENGHNKPHRSTLAALELALSSAEKERTDKAS